MELVGRDVMNLVGEFYLYRDKETGVEYIVYKNSDGISITPRYDEDGNVYRK